MIHWSLLVRVRWILRQRASPTIHWLPKSNRRQWLNQCRSFRHWRRLNLSQWIVGLALQGSHRCNFSLIISPISSLHIIRSMFFYNISVKSRTQDCLQRFVSSSSTSTQVAFRPMISYLSAWNLEKPRFQVQEWVWFPPRNSVHVTSSVTTTESCSRKILVSDQVTARQYTVKVWWQFLRSSFWHGCWS